MTLQTNTHSGEQLTFHQLLHTKNYHIEIPIIQRDYAQGRLNSTEVRKLFLDALFNYLEEDKPFRDLDFIYGKVVEVNKQMSKFIPLDGQQRLTTLFLLHWYLAKRADRFEEFQVFMLHKNKSKFTYETRASSREFCDALVNQLIHLF